jgi:hypothetical protein
MGFLDRFRRGRTTRDEILDRELLVPTLDTGLDPGPRSSKSQPSSR